MKTTSLAAARARTERQKAGVWYDARLGGRYHLRAPRYTEYGRIREELEAAARKELDLAASGPLPEEARNRAHVVAMFRSRLCDAWEGVFADEAGQELLEFTEENFVDLLLLDLDLAAELEQAVISRSTFEAKKVTDTVRD